MRVDKCTKKDEVTERYPLSWDDIKEREGIYTSEWNESNRFIVLSKFDGTCYGYLILRDGKDLHACPDGFSSMGGYRRIDGAKLCCEIRE